MARTRISYDQLVKQLLADFPYDALAFFCGPEARDLGPDVRITLLGQEQGSRRLGRGHRIVDVLPIVEWPDGSRQARVFLIEQKLHPTRAAVFQVAHYLLSVAQRLEKDRGPTDIVPVLIFVKDGRVSTRIEVGSARRRYLTFDCVGTHLAEMDAEQALESGNLAAAANVMSMTYPPEQKVELCRRAMRVWRERVQDPDLARKYCEHLLQCSRMSEPEKVELRRNLTDEEGQFMNTLFDDLRDEGRKEGRVEGLADGVFALLAANGVALSETDRRRILDCQDIDQLRQWLVRAATAKSAAALFATH